MTSQEQVWTVLTFAYCRYPEKWGLNVENQFTIGDRDLGNWGKFEFGSHSTEHMTSVEIMEAAENVRLELLKLYSMQKK